MNKETIIKRLIDQGHVSITVADSILNKRDFYVTLITELHTDGNINAEETICLLNENPTQSIVDLKEKIRDGVVDTGYSQALGKDEVNPIDYHLTTLKTQIDYLHRLRTQDNSEKHDELIHDLIKLVKYLESLATPNIQTFPSYPQPHHPFIPPVQPDWKTPDIYCDGTGPTGNCGSVGTDGTNRPTPAYQQETYNQDIP